MGTLLQSTLNTRALPTGNLRFIRSDYPGKLTDQEVKWLLQNDITTVVDLREEKEYIAKPCRLDNVKLVSQIPVSLMHKKIDR